MYPIMKWVLRVKIELGEISCADALDTFSCFTLLKREAFLFEVGCLDFFRQPNLWSQTVRTLKVFENLLQISF